MGTLSSEIRSQLERQCVKARDLSEAGAERALNRLCVNENEPRTNLSPEERNLRVRLRARMRQLESFEDLISECAYEKWHRMLFARFLAENQLLIHPKHNVAVTLEECKELAEEEGEKSGWELAAKYAHKMLPQIFRKNDPVLEVKFLPEDSNELEKLLSEIMQEVFHADDGLGWVYQFWQSKKKNEVNASEVKIGAKELPAVTQLFTEPYMVSFLLDNSLGAWWAARKLSDDDLMNAETEKDLRQKASIPGVPLEYLRFIKEDDGKWRPAAGTFDAWPQYLSEFKVLDPCCGSGHFLVAALQMLVPIRMKLENINAKEAIDAVLSQNLHGLDIDKRVTEITAFALAFTAWRFPDSGGFRQLPMMNIACSGLPVKASKETWQKFANGIHNLRIALGTLHEEFKNAPTLGSLLDPAKSPAARIVEWDELIYALTKALEIERIDLDLEAGVIAQESAKAAEILTFKYQLVITNVPYLVRGKQGKIIRDYCNNIHEFAKNDLATVFLNHGLELCDQDGCVSMVLPQNWLFLTSYKSLRQNLLMNKEWLIVARLGLNAFQTPLRVAPVLFMIQNSLDNYKSFYNTKEKSIFYALDSSDNIGIDKKEYSLTNASLVKLVQNEQVENPDSRVIFTNKSKHQFLSNFADSSHGQGSFDNPRFTFNYWELSRIEDGWILQQSSASETKHFDGCHYIFRWQAGKGDLWKMMEAKKLYGYTSGKWMAGTKLFGKNGILVNQMSNMPTTLYLGSAFNENASVISPYNEAHLIPIYCFCRSDNFRKLVREIDQELKVTCKSLIKIPVDLAYWQKVAEENYPNGLPKPYTNDPIQWIFHGHPCGRVVWDEEKKWTIIDNQRTDETVFQIALARLLGYRWPAELDKDIELSDEARELVAKCDSLLHHADEDGIVCIPSVSGEKNAEDRLRDLLADAFGEEWSPGKLGELVHQVGFEGKSLEGWLRSGFFQQHCKLFHHRPFIWQIWDGLKDGFSVLINYHKLDKTLLERLIYSYLGDWIKRQRDAIDHLVEGAENKLRNALILERKLKLILKGEYYDKPHEDLRGLEEFKLPIGFDIFVRWKPLHEQPIGWNPDLNDGVRLNIRPFMTTGVLRWKPNIKWNKDRGKDVESAPWYSLCPHPVHGGNKGDRINDHHLTIDEKQAERDEFTKQDDEI